MATSNDEAGGSRLWRGMRHLIFGDEAEPTLRHEIEEAIDDAEDSRPVAGDLSPAERQMLRNLLHFGERTAGDICVTRGDIIAVPSTIAFDDLIRAFVDAEHSRLPVYGESLDEVIGMVHIKDLFIANFDASRDRSLASLMRNPLFVPESMGAIDLLARMRAEDVVEEIVGEIEDEHDIEEGDLLTMLDDGLWEADARLELDDLREAVDPRLTAEGDEVDTVGGLTFILAGRILQPGESVEHPSGWRLESVDADARRIKRVRLHAPEGEAPAK